MFSVSAITLEGNTPVLWALSSQVGFPFRAIFILNKQGLFSERLSSILCSSSLLISGGWDILSQFPLSNFCWEKKNVSSQQPSELGWSRFRFPVGANFILNKQGLNFILRWMAFYLVLPLSEFREDKTSAITLPLSNIKICVNHPVIADNLKVSKWASSLWMENISHDKSSEIEKLEESRYSLRTWNSKNLELMSRLLRLIPQAFSIT